MSVCPGGGGGDTRESSVGGRGSGVGVNQRVLQVLSLF